MTDKQWLFVLVTLVGMMLLASYLGVNKYKHSCEKIMSADQTQTWLECKL